jgi:hypothetical protein
MFLVFVHQSSRIVVLSNGLFVVVGVFFTLAPNGLQLGEVAEIEARMFSFAQKFNRRTAVEFSTKPAILPN